MAEYDQLSDNRALVRTMPPNDEDGGLENERDFRAQVQQYGQQANEALNRAKGYAQEYIGQASDKFRDLQNKDFGQIAEEAKDFARRKPGQAIAISAAAGLIIGLILRGRR